MCVCVHAFMEIKLRKLAYACNGFWSAYNAHLPKEKSVEYVQFVHADNG